MTVLGCGAAAPTPYFLTTSQLVNIHDQLILIDCGEATQVTLRKSRDKFQKIKTYNPDTLHLHQLIHDQVKYKFNSSNYLYTHFITSLIINIYNLSIFIIAIRFVYNSKILIAIILLNILVYIFLYNFLIRIKLK